MCFGDDKQFVNKRVRKKHNSKKSNPINKWLQQKVEPCLALQRTWLLRESNKRPTNRRPSKAILIVRSTCIGAFCTALGSIWKRSMSKSTRCLELQFSCGLIDGNKQAWIWFIHLHHLGQWYLHTWQC
jgi:hypothetical protein